ncbi:hypothetical protein ACSBOB_33265 [Mesorhizobium sp. ASY16-5R]|uniref:hypothetical protein n=1 Tax=Mesorhizobium sp. ASY16-5R TaxID=3445772 RepID=UPI003FA1851A
MRVRDLLRSAAADDFIRGVARFTLSKDKQSLADIKHAVGRDNAKWTVVTYLPFLWRPEEHLFLKPEVTRDFAERVGHRYQWDYKPDLDITVYESLLDLRRRTENELEDLEPRDGIDIQSFIWVIGAYDLEPQL